MGEARENAARAEALLAEANTKFEVDLRDRGAVHNKAQALAAEVRKAGGHDYSQVDALTRLLDEYDQVTGGPQEEVRQQAA